MKAIEIVSIIMLWLSTVYFEKEATKIEEKTGRDLDGGDIGTSLRCIGLLMLFFLVLALVTASIR